MQQFNLLDAPLKSTVLIEASAGTGKTYTLTGLYGRLIIEKGLTVDQILVVTFTVAATEELKGRIRAWLVTAREAFRKGSSADRFLHALVERHAHHDLAVEALQNALTNFDQAAIFTIHGFCQRILQDHAFETGRLFEGEVVAEQTQTLVSVADDFWRRHIYASPAEISNYLSGKIKRPEYFMHLLRSIPVRGINYIPKPQAPDWRYLNSFKDRLRLLKQQWHPCRPQVEDLLRTPALKANIYGKVEDSGAPVGASPRSLKVRAILDSVEKWLFSSSVGFPLVKELASLTRAKLIRATKKGQAPPDHPLFDLCDVLYNTAADLQKEADAYLIYLKGAFIAYADHEIEKQNRRHNRFFFDDLLYAVFDALSRQPDSELAATVRRQYTAALVDEFQDTDSIQYTIFERLFSGSNCLLYLIGDPKQAIYGFRGADIFTYMRASRSIATKLTLTRNYRAAPELIAALNILFATPEAPFIFPEITFEPAQAHQDAGKNPAQNLKPGLTFGWLATPEMRPITKTDAEPLCARTVAQAIL